MTKSGHRATALALGAAGLIYLGIPNGIGWLIGCLFGASAPDYLEVHYGGSGPGQKTFLRHRTWTHQPLLWIACIIAYAHLELQSTPYHFGVLAWFCSALLHLCMDATTPLGIPLGFPWSKRTSLNLYTPGTSEMPLILLVWGICLAPFYVPTVVTLIHNYGPFMADLFSTGK
jgi:membrane-bound metal-dependent hydrolase YbcI (DUF457 family)